MVFAWAGDWACQNTAVWKAADLATDLEIQLEIPMVVLREMTMGFALAFELDF